MKFVFTKHFESRHSGNQAKPEHPESLVSMNKIEQTIIREKQIKDMNRKYKLAMIYKFNLEFKDLFDQITG